MPYRILITQDIKKQRVRGLGTFAYRGDDLGMLVERLVEIAEADQVGAEKNSATAGLTARTPRYTVRMA
jgi:hypothetical protein